MIYSETDRWVTIIVDDNVTYTLETKMFTFNKWDRSSDRTDEISYRTNIHKKCGEDKIIRHWNTEFDNVDSTQRWSCSLQHTSVRLIIKFQSFIGVTTESLWYNGEQAFLYTINLMSHWSCRYNLHVWYDTTMSRVCNRNLLHPPKICRSFMHIWIRSPIRVILLGIISYSNIVRHDQWHAFLNNLIQISSIPHYL